MLISEKVKINDLGLKVNCFWMQSCWSIFDLQNVQNAPNLKNQHPIIIIINTSSSSSLKNQHLIIIISEKSTPHHHHPTSSSSIALYILLNDQIEGGIYIYLKCEAPSVAFEIYIYPVLGTMVIHDLLFYFLFYIINIDIYIYISRTGYIYISNATLGASHLRYIYIYPSLYP